MDDSMDAILALARDPGTPGPVLDRLAEHLYPSTPLSEAERQALAAALARNPNASPSLLEPLMGIAPADFLENPVIELLWLERPAWFETCRYLPRVTALSQAPRWLLEIAVQRLGSLVQDETPYLLQNPALPADLAEEMALCQVERSSAEKGRLLPFHPNLDPRVGPLLDRLRPAWEGYKPWQRWPVEGCPLSPDEAAFLAARGRGHARLLAVHGGVDPAILMPYLDPLEPGVATVAARRRDLPLDVYHRMVDGFAFDLAGNPGCPPEVLLRVVEQARGNAAVREALLQNPSLPAEGRRILGPLGSSS